VNREAHYRLIHVEMRARGLFQDHLALQKDFVERKVVRARMAFHRTAPLGIFPQRSALHPPPSCSGQNSKAIAQGAPSPLLPGGIMGLAYEITAKYCV
jgi:hypothetical protein